MKKYNVEVAIHATKTFAIFADSREEAVAAAIKKANDRDFNLNDLSFYQVSGSHVSEAEGEEQLSIVEMIDYIVAFVEAWFDAHEDVDSLQKKFLCIDVDYSHKAITCGGRAEETVYSSGTIEGIRYEYGDVILDVQPYWEHDTVECFLPNLSDESLVKLYNAISSAKSVQRFMRKINQA